MATTSFNRVQLLGNLGADPEVRVVAQQTPVATFRVATDHTYRTAEGVERMETEWTTVEVWRGLATTCAEHLQKGSRVFVEGRLHTRSWQDGGDVTQHRTEVRADRVIFLDRRAAPERQHAEDIIVIDEFAPL